MNPLTRLSESTREEFAADLSFTLLYSAPIQVILDHIGVAV